MINQEKTVWAVMTLSKGLNGLLAYSTTLFQEKEDADKFIYSNIDRLQIGVRLVRLKIN